MCIGNQVLGDHKDLDKSHKPGNVKQSSFIEDSTPQNMGVGQSYEWKKAPCCPRGYNFIRHFYFPILNLLFIALALGVLGELLYLGEKYNFSATVHGITHSSP